VQLDRMRTAIEYGVPTDRCGLQLRLGVEKGFFREEDIDFHIRVVFGGPEIASEFDSGRLPIGELGTPPGLTALARGGRFKIIGGLGSRYPKILELIAANSLDGAILSEPHVAMGESAGLFKVWLGMNRLDFVQRMQWTIAVANNAMLANEADLVAAILRGCRRSYRYAADNRDEWADFGAHYFKISRDTMIRSIEREFGDLHFDCAIDIEGLAAAVALQRELGAVTAPLGLRDTIDDRFVSLAADVRACDARHVEMGGDNGYG
jgi:ABC-type nitrate/sulfonate/bicarbonate transport system substrate-binding protein